LNLETLGLRLEKSLLLIIIPKSKLVPLLSNLKLHTKQPYLAISTRRTRSRVPIYKLLFIFFIAYGPGIVYTNEVMHTKYWQCTCTEWILRLLLVVCKTAVRVLQYCKFIWCDKSTTTTHSLSHQYSLTVTKKQNTLKVYIDTHTVRHRETMLIV